MKTSNTGPYSYNVVQSKSPNSNFATIKVNDPLAGVSVPSHQLEGSLSGKVKSFT